MRSYNTIKSSWNTHLIERNAFPKEYELCKNNGWSHGNFSHLVEPNTANELNCEETGAKTRLELKR